jgi:hypothetical protein
MKDDSVKNEGPKPKKNNNASSLKSQIPKGPFDGQDKETGYDKPIISYSYLAFDAPKEYDT